MPVVAIALAGAVGIALGMLGGGGSILMVPLLTYVGGLDAKQAIATSLVIVSATPPRWTTIARRRPGWRHWVWRWGSRLGSSAPAVASCWCPRWRYSVVCRCPPRWARRWW
jgi:uncharacterized membrane protein YfcA